jgi:hypothetical protein
MRSVCFIASDNVVIDGDVVFIDQDKFGSDICVYIPTEIKLFRCTKNGLHIFPYGKCPQGNLKLKALWFWHMVILRKSHVYLTGIMK